MQELQRGPEAGLGRLGERFEGGRARVPFLLRRAQGFRRLREIGRTQFEKP